MLEFLSSDFVKLSLPLLAASLTAVVAWLVNERSKRAQEEYARKEQNYKTLLSSVQGFYVETQDPKKIETFLDQLILCWLYCPDDVIERGYAFLDTLIRGVSDASFSTMGELVVAIRKDMLSRKIVNKTNLQAKDLKHWRPTVIRVPISPRERTPTA